MSCALINSSPQNKTVITYSPSRRSNLYDFLVTLEHGIGYLEKRLFILCPYNRSK